MKSKYKSFEEKMASYHVLIWNATEPEIQQVLEAGSMTIEKLENLKTLYTNTRNASDNQEIEHKEMHSAYDAYSDSKLLLDNNFKTNRKWFRMALRKNLDLASNIGLYLPLKTKNFPRIQQLVSIYQKMLSSPEAMEMISPYGFTAEIINQEITQLQNLVFLYDKSIQEKGEAQLSTENRDRMIEELDDACNELKVVATLLFADNEQVLEKLGIIVKSK